MCILRTNRETISLTVVQFQKSWENHNIQSWCAMVWSFSAFGDLQLYRLWPLVHLEVCPDEEFFLRHSKESVRGLLLATQFILL